MEIELQANNKDTLMHGLTAWNRIENMFREVFKEESLKDRDYLKMKLAEYDRLHYRHSGSIRTTDERALMNMLRFQRRKMERSLYPGLLTRMVRRVVRYLGPAINAGAEVEMAKQAGTQLYLDRNLPLSEPLQASGQMRPVDQKQAEGRRPAQTLHREKGLRPRQAKRSRQLKRKGPSM